MNNIMKKNLFYSKTKYKQNIQIKKMKTQHYLLLLAIFVLTTSFTIACKKSNDNKPLVNTYWQLTHIEGETVTKSPHKLSEDTNFAVTVQYQFVFCDIIEDFGGRNCF